MRTPFVVLVGLLGAYGLSKDLPNLEAVLALYDDAPNATASGADLYRKCAICHSLSPGEHRIGPSLHCVVGRPIAAEPGYRYSSGMRSAQIDSAFGVYEPQHWTRETLTAYMLDPQVTFGNTRMPFPGLMASVADEDLFDVTDTLIAYLEDRCDDQIHELVALHPLESNADAGKGLACMTIAREQSLPACQAMAENLRSGDSEAGDGLPTLACIRPGKLACGPGDAGQ